MKLKPIFDRVVLKPIPLNQSSSSGLVLPETTQEKPLVGEVIAIGEGNIVDGVQQEMKVKTGDVVLFSKYAGTEFKFERKEYIIIRETDILAILENYKGEN